MLQIQEAFHERERPDATLAELRETRAVAIEEVFTEWYGRQTDPLTPAAHARWSWRPLLPLRPWVVRQATQVLEVSGEAVAAASQPWPQKLNALQSLARRQPDPRTGRGRTSLVDYPRYIIRGVGEEGVIRDAVRLVHVQSAQVAIAVGRFRRDHDDAVPRTLGDLVPAYLAAVPADPFTGAPLKLLVARDRFVV